MRKVFKSVVFAILFAILPFNFSFGDDFSIDVSNEMKSHHLGLGMELQENPVDRICVDLGVGALSAEFLMNVDLKKELLTQSSFYVELSQEVLPGIDVTFNYSQLFTRKVAGPWDEIPWFETTVDLTKLPFAPSLYFARFFGYEIISTLLFPRVLI